jgi:hypothetical protein
LIAVISRVMARGAVALSSSAFTLPGMTQRLTRRAPVTRVGRESRMFASPV